MEQMIKNQKESIVELEAKIAANMDEIKKVYTSLHVRYRYAINTNNIYQSISFSLISSQHNLSLHNAQPHTHTPTHTPHTSTHTQVNDLFQDTQQSLEETSQQLSEASKCLETTREHLSKTVDDLHTTRLERDEKEFLVTEHVKSEGTLLEEAAHVSSFVSVSTVYNIEASMQCNNRTSYSACNIMLSTCTCTCTTSKGLLSTTAADDHCPRISRRYSRSTF